jgi:hypothetical protein
MPDRIQNRSGVAVLLLCALLAVMSIVSSFCPRCDGSGDQYMSQAHVIGKTLPPASDDCDGVCSCCGFHWLAPMEMRLPTVAGVTTLPIPYDEHYPSRLAPPPFLPPRA